MSPTTPGLLPPTPRTAFSSDWITIFPTAPAWLHYFILRLLRFFAAIFWHERNGHGLETRVTFQGENAKRVTVYRAAAVTSRCACDNM
jgi:hypothetical protein